MSGNGIDRVHVVEEKERPVQKTGHHAIAQRAEVRKKRTIRLKTAPWFRFVAAADELEMTALALVSAVGYNEANFYIWQKAGNCTFVAVAAAEAMVRAHRARKELMELRETTPEPVVLERLRVLEEEKTKLTQLVRDLEEEKAALEEVATAPRPVPADPTRLFVAYPTKPEHLAAIKAVCDALGVLNTYFQPER